jgi:NitT/TauT family transport system substrate-binding protein
MRRSALIRSAVAAGAWSAVLRSRPSAAQGLSPVNIGAVFSVLDAPLLVANEKGFFRDVGIQANFNDFNSGANMISSIGTGQIDVGGGAASAGLYNGVGRGIEIKIVSDRGTDAPGYGFTPLVVRKDLIASGKVKSIADLKGLKVAEAGRGATNLCQIVKALATVGLSYDDVQHVFLGFPAQVTALQNGSIDATMSVEPYATLITKRGIGVVLERDDKFYPNEQIGVIFYSGKFATQKADIAERFMVAYLRGQRYVLDALKGPHFAGPNAEEVVAILTRELKIPPDVLREMTVGYADPNGQINAKSLNEDLAIYKQHNLIVGNATVEQIVDPSFAESAAKQLGPYKPKR